MPLEVTVDCIFLLSKVQDVSEYFEDILTFRMYPNAPAAKASTIPDTTFLCAKKPRVDKVHSEHTSDPKAVIKMLPKIRHTKHGREALESS